MLNIMDYAKIIDAVTEHIDEAVEVMGDEQISALCQVSEDLKLEVGWIHGFCDAIDLLAIVVTPSANDLLNHHKKHADELATTIIRTLKEFSLI